MKRIVILYSGGLDSLCMAKWAEVHYPYDEVIKLWFDIGQPYREFEQQALPDDVVQRRIDWMQPGQKTVGKKDSKSKSGDIFIPGRNLVFAVMAACVELPDEIWIGALNGETTPHNHDKNEAFLFGANQTINYVLQNFLEQPLRVRFPLVEAGFNKLTATRWLIQNGATLDEVTATRSCLSGDEKPCGKCIVCLRRWGVFSQLGFSEGYQHHPMTQRENFAVIKEMLFGDHYETTRKNEILPAVFDYFGTNIPELVLQRFKEELE